jgi:hypothetical protein
MYAPHSIAVFKGAELLIITVKIIIRQSNVITDYIISSYDAPSD